MTLPLEEKIGQMCMVGFQGLEPPDHILEWLSTGRIGGVILFARNVDTPEQLARLTQICHQAASRPILIAIDQEGGVVARLRVGFTESPGAMALGAAGLETQAYEVSRVLATELQALGINWDYAPVVDLTHDIRNASVGCRSLGSDKDQVSRLAAAEIKGFQAGGVAACTKHFPGLGNTPIDTHEALARISDSIEVLWETDLVPFRAAVAAGSASVMVSHVLFDKLDSQYPSTLSPVVINQVLRQELNFNGVVSTDCMEMKAVSDHYGPGESAVLAALAGVDLILFSHTRAYQEQAYEALLSAAQIGRLTEERINQSVSRIQAMKERFKITNPLNPGIIRHPDHLQIMQEAARNGIVLLHSDGRVFPLGTNGQRIGVIEFASPLESRVVEDQELTRFEKFLKENLPHVESISLHATERTAESLAQARKLALEAEVLIVATRNAHLNPEQLRLASEFLGAAKHSILLCLRNPYDAGVLPSANTILCTCGDSTPSLQAAADALTGIFAPTGQLPVPI